MMENDHLHISRGNLHISSNRMLVLFEKLNKIVFNFCHILNI